MMPEIIDTGWFIDGPFDGQTIATPEGLQVYEYSVAPPIELLYGDAKPPENGGEVKQGRYRRERLRGPYGAPPDLQIWVHEGTTLQDAGVAAWRRLTGTALI